MKLQGGEPLINDRVLDYMKITREIFPNSQICLFTDGLLLPKWSSEQNNIWKVIKECEIEIRMTQYPIPLKLEDIVNAAKEYNIPVTFDHNLNKSG